MIESNSKIDQRICQVPETQTGFFQPLVADHQFPVGVLPGEGAFHFVAFAVRIPIEPAIQPSDGHGRLRVAAVGADDRNQPLAFDERLIVFGIKPAIQSEAGALQIHADPTGELSQRGEGLGKDSTVVLIHGPDRDRSQDEAMIVRNGYFFFVLLVLVARVANPRSPFLTTVLLPSPWSRLRPRAPVKTGMA